MTTQRTALEAQLQDALADLSELQTDLPRLVSLFLKHEAEEKRAASALRGYQTLLETFEDAMRRRAEVLSVLEQQNAEIEAAEAKVETLWKQNEAEKDRLKQPQYEFADEAGLES